jgi:hypothetical protein
MPKKKPKQELVKEIAHEKVENTKLDGRFKQKEIAFGTARGVRPIKHVINDLLKAIPPTGEIPEHVIDAIMEIESYLGKRMTRQQLMAHAIINRAMHGNVDAFREVMDRTEGKVANKNENKNMNLTYEDWLKSQAGEKTVNEEDDDTDDMAGSF